MLPQHHQAPSTHHVKYDQQKGPDSKGFCCFALRWSAARPIADSQAIQASKLQVMKPLTQTIWQNAFGHAAWCAMY